LPSPLLSTLLAIIKYDFNIEYMLSTDQLHVEYRSSTCWVQIKYMFSTNQVHVEHISSTCCVLIKCML